MPFHTIPFLPAAPARTSAPPVLVATSSDELAAAAGAALRQLDWPARRARSLAETALCTREHPFHLMLLDVRFCGERGHVPGELRGPHNKETPVLSLASVAEADSPYAFFRHGGGGSVGAEALAELLAVELDRQSSAHVLKSACRLVGAPSALPVPSALALSEVSEPDEIEAAHKRGAKQILRVAKALSNRELHGDNQLEKLWPALGPLPFGSLANVAAARLLFPLRDPEHRRLMDRLARFALARAVTMRWLAARTALGSGLEASRIFDAGLLADIGASLLVYLADQGEPRFTRRFGHGLPPELAGHHEWLGGRLCARWQRGAAIVEAADAHHGLDERGTTSELAVAAAALVEDAGIASDLTGDTNAEAAQHLYSSWRISAEECRRMAPIVLSEVERLEDIITA